MSHRLLLLSLATLLAFPFPAPAQTQDEAAQSDVEERVFLGAIELVRRMHLSEFNDSTLWTRALDGLIEGLADPYASVFTPLEVEAFQESTTGNYAGIGVSIVQLNDFVTITGVFRGAPAAEAGLQVGDVILSVNGHDASDWSTATASDSIRGEVGTSVDMEVRRDGVRQPLSFTLQRDSVHVSAVQWGLLPDGVGYITLDRVARQSAREFTQALDSLGEARGILIDLRRNPGGYLDESLMMADVMLARGELLATTRNRRSGGSGEISEESYRGRMRPRIPQKPVVVLVDRYTASAAEIVTGALQDHDRALVLGERTFGKGVVQSVMDLPHGRKLRITTGSWHTPLGRSLHRERDVEGNPLPENLDTIAPLRTAGGRTLRSGGGVFPDLEIAPDTLTSLERELIAVAEEQGVRMGTREAEAAFARARALAEAEQPPSVDDATFEAYVRTLASAGLEDQVGSEEIRGYLRWRLTINVADRMEDVAASTMARAERDPMLRLALALLGEAETQDELFAGAALEKARTDTEGTTLGTAR